ncbi:MAG: carotenoid oxygenase family protein [Anaerolineaceae bacterium]|nr:carotenoid oxygenase family protein [Anaerolineaceae bacterium]
MSAPYITGFSETPAEITLESLPIQGSFPQWLVGTLIRNGPGTFHAGSQSYRHWFDGLAMLHKFSFARGKVSYANKYLETKSYQSARETGKITYSEFATDPCRSLFARGMAFFFPKITDSAKVNVARIADHYMALAETPIQVEFDIDTLKTVGVFNYEERIVGQMTTVHPQFDFSTGDVYNVVTRYHALSHYNIYRIHPSGSTQRIGSVPVMNPAYLHSFGMSHKYIILAEFPLVVNPIHLLLWLKPYIENFRWEPARGTPFTVVNRHTGEIAGRFECDSFFAFHHVNAFEKGGELVIDLVGYDDASIIQSYYLNRLSDEHNELPAGTLRRYRLPLNQKRGRVRSEVLSDAFMELPRFDYERLNMDSSYRYVYASSINPDQRSGFYNQVVKIDVTNGRQQTWHQAGCYPGEPVFVGRPGRSAEDDGVILSVILDSIKGNSFLLALDAHTFTEIGRAEVPHPILFGYHGEFFPPHPTMHSEGS